MDHRDSALWKDIKDKLYPDGLIRGKEGEKKRQQLAEIDAEYAKEQKKGSSEKNGNKREQSILPQVVPAVEDIIPAAEYKFDTASDLLATTAGAVFLVGQEPALSRQMVELVKEKMILHTGKAITPFLATEKELYLTKMDLTSAFKETATQHKRLASLYTKIGKKNPWALELVPKHKDLAATNLAAADTATIEAEILKEKYGFTVSRPELKTAASPKLTPAKRGAATTPEQRTTKKQTPTLRERVERAIVNGSGQDEVDEENGVEGSAEEGTEQQGDVEDCAGEEDEEA